jgi:tetratricopeptide (TPR) repeat protein
MLLPSSKSKEIETIEDLFLKGNYYKVIALSDKILTNKDSSELDTIHANLLKGKSLSLLTTFEQRWEQIGEEELIYFENAVRDSSQQESLILKLDSLEWLAGTQSGLHRYEDALKTLDKMEQIYKSSKDQPPTDLKHTNAIMIGVKASKLNIEFFLGRDSPENRIEILIKYGKERLKLFQELNFQWEIITHHFSIGYQYHSIGDYQKALKYFEDGLKLSEKVGNKYAQSTFLRSITDAFWLLGDIDKIPDYINRAIILDEELENKLLLGQNQNWFGIYNAEKGDWNQALEYFKKALEYYEKNNQKFSIVAGYNNIGVVYAQKGDIDKALEHHLKAQQLWEELEIPGPSRRINNIARIYFLKGELEKAYNLLKNEIEVCEKFENKYDLAQNLFLLSDVLWQQGKTNEALIARERHLKLRKEFGNKLYFGYALGHMIAFYVETNQHEQAKDYLDQFKSIIDEIDNKPLLLNYRFSEALVLKISEQHRDRIKAELLFEQLLEEELTYTLQIDVLQTHVTRLYDFAVSNKSHLLTVEALWLQSQIAMIELDVKKAKETLQKAQKIIDEKGLERLVVKIANEQEKLDELSSDLIEAGKKAYSVSKRMELVKVQNTVKDIKKNRLVEDALEDVSTSKTLFSLRI